MSVFLTIPEAIDRYREGRTLIVVDDEERENEGDFVVAAERVVPETVNFMSKHGRGLICVGMTGDLLDRLDLHPMVHDNTSKLGTSFTVSVDAIHGTTTGISAQDRALTVRTLIDPNSKPDDLARPGHVFPLRASEGGVLCRAGHTEAAADLARLAGLVPAGVLCEIMDEDGSMARLPRLESLAERFGMGMVTIRDLIAYRMVHDKLVRRAVSTQFPTEYGEFILHLYESDIDEHHHLALVRGDITPDEPVLVRVHSECLTGDVFGSMRCDCGEQLHRAMKMIHDEGKGIVLYMRQEGRGIGLSNKIRAYRLQDQGKDTVEANLALGFPADLRDYGIGAQILVDLGARKLKLITNNPKKVVGLRGYGLEISERVPLVIRPNAVNSRYLETKRDKLGHLISKDWILPSEKESFERQAGG
jgi:3,4-dihydroxy 2-butanone 4-phosphate synthase/GTP cyclohydrolase II